MFILPGHRGIKMKILLRTFLKRIFILLTLLVSESGSAGMFSSVFFNKSQWKPMSTVGAPEARALHYSVWDDVHKRLIVWGGLNGSNQVLNTGGIYNLKTDTWTAMSTVGAPVSRTMNTMSAFYWTGSKLIVWGRAGGELSNTGKIYDPATNTWSAMSTTGAPTLIWNNSVWTGTKMMLWSGRVTGCYAPFNGQVVTGPLLAPDGSPCYKQEGALYDPVTDTWAPISTAGAPSPREVKLSLMGTKVVAWSGSSGSSAIPLDTGAIYDTLTNTWSPMPVMGFPYTEWVSVLLPAGGGAAIGTKLFRWNGQNPGTIYDSVTNSWSLMSSVGAPPLVVTNSNIQRRAGSRFIVWGGSDASNVELNTGGIYDPATNTWKPTSTYRAPSGRVYHSGHWTGSSLIVWGGRKDFVPTNTGGIYRPYNVKEFQGP